MKRGQRAVQPSSAAVAGSQPGTRSTIIGMYSRSIEIEAPADRVWAVMSDVERWHEWTPSVTKVTLAGTGPLAVGRRATIRQPRFPPALWKITEVVPERSFTWVSVAPLVRVVARHSVEALAPGRTRALLSLEYFGLVGTLLAKWTKGITLRYLDMEAEGLKARSLNAGYRHGQV